MNRVKQSGVDENEQVLRAARNESVREATSSTLLGLAGIYAIIALRHLFVLPRDVLPLLFSQALLVCFVYVGLRFAIRRWTLPLRWVHPFASVVVLIALLDSLVQMYVLRDPFQSMNIALVIIGAGIYLLSARWLLTAISVSVASWLAMVLLIDPGVSSNDWMYFANLILLSAFLSSLNFAGRLRAFDRIYRLHTLDAVRQRELEAALRAVRESEEQLQRAHRELELQVKAQNAQLEQTNQELSFEVNERRRTEADIRFLAQASASLSETLDFDETLGRIPQLVVSYLADYCVIELVDHEDSRRTALAHVNPEKCTVLRSAMDNHYVPFDTAAVVQSAQPVLRSRLTTAEYQALCVLRPGNDRLMRFLQPCGYMIVPLVIGGATIGTLSLVSAESRRVFEQRHLNLAVDVAHRAALAIEHARLYQRAHTAIMARDTFVSIAAHELRSPLTALNGYAQLLFDRGATRPDADPFQRRALQTMLTQSQRLEQLINTMLDLSQIDNEQLALRFEQLDLAELLQGVVDSLRMLVDLHTIIYVNECTAPVPVRGDALRLEQVFRNLLQNAIKYSPNGGDVIVTMRREHNDVLVSVADSGIGIAEQDIPRLFQRFYRAASAERSHIKGLGIGLYVVREIVERHGGSITVASTEWEGSTFTVRLPLNETAQEK